MNETPQDSANNEASTATASPRGDRTPMIQMLAHLVAGGAIGGLVGAVDGWLAADRTGLETLTTGESTAAIMLGVGLNLVAGVLFGFIAGCLWVGLTRFVSAETIRRRLFSRRGLGISAAGITVLCLAVYLYGEHKLIEWHAIDLRAPIMLLVAFGLYPLTVASQRSQTVAIGLPVVVVLALVSVLIGWPQAGEARAEGLVRVGTESATSRPLLLLARKGFDGDGDAFPTSLCELDCDCDDANDAVFPGAEEVPGNDIDEDCSGKDLSNAEVERFEDALGLNAEPAPPARDIDVEAVADPPEDKGPPNVLFITIDTLRADHLGCYGYSRNTSPNLDALCDRAVVFEQARATGPQTRFSVPAMVTGKYFTEIRRTGGKWPKIKKKEKLLGEHFKEAGYQTFSFHSIFYFREIYGMAQGFDYHDESVISERHPVQETPTSDLVTDKILEFSENIETTEPWMLWAYYADPHSSYVLHEDAPRFGPTRPDYYDSEIAFTDMHVGRLLEGLETRGLLDNTVIVITSDHGEGLDPEKDHGHRFHGPNLYDEVMRVPLIVAGPDWSPIRVATPVSLIDLLPTFRELARLPPDPELRGLSLLPWLRGEDPPHPPVFFEKHKATALPQKGMVLWPYKVILVMPYNRVKIYNLEDDPAEQHDLSRKMPEAEKEELVGLLNYWATSVLQSIEPRP